MVGEPDNAPPTVVSRLEDHLSAARECPKKVLFDAFHDMTTVGGQTGADPLFQSFYPIVAGQPYHDKPVPGCAAAP
jgi:hypothetical protein